MQSTIDAHPLLLFVFHAFHARDTNCLTIFVGVPQALRDSDYSSFGNGDIFKDDFHGLLSISIQDLEILSKVIKYLSIGPVAIGREEEYLATSAKLVQSQLLLMRNTGGNHHFEPSNRRKILRFVLEFAHLHIVVQFLQFVDTTVQSWLAHVFSS